MSAPATSGQVRFGLYQCDLAAGELYKNGVRLRLADQPLRLLTILLERPGEMVSRKEIAERLWGAGTFVDFDDGLNTCVNKLRAALDDKAENPQFIETIPRRGYRFIAEVSQLSPEPAVVKAPPARLRRWPWAVGAVAGLGLIWWLTPLPPPEVTGTDQITTASRIDMPVRPISDGARIYYNERDGDHWDLMQVPVRGGAAERVETPGPSANLFGVSARTGELLLGIFTARDTGRQLWTMPAQGGPAQRIGGGSDIGEAIFSPSGNQILYERGATLWLMQADGSGAHKLVELPQAAQWLAWSPDGERIRFNVGGGAEAGIGEITAAGSGLHRIALPQGLAACCGTWTRDGRYFIFTGTTNGKTNLWALREQGSMWRRSPQGPYQLTYGPDQPAEGAPGADGRHIYFYNGLGRSQPQRVNPNTGSYQPLPSRRLDTYSRDRAWVAYVDPETGALVRSRANGGDPLVLAGSKYGGDFPRWSPDGEWIAFTGALDAQPGAEFVVAANGGAVTPLLQDGRDERDADWSPDGQTLVVSRARSAKDASQRELDLVDFKTRQVRTIPGSDNLAASRWSYSGRYISATTADQHELRLWQVSTRQWRTVARGVALGIAEWSPDSRYLYFQDLLAPGEPLFRYAADTGRVTKVADFSLPLAAGALRCAFWGVDPAGDPIMRFDRSGADLFAASVELP